MTVKAASTSDRATGSSCSSECVLGDEQPVKEKRIQKEVLRMDKRVKARDTRGDL